VAGLPELEALESWRQELARRSDRYRDSLTVDCRNIESSTRWMRKTIAWGRAAAPLLVWIAPVGLMFLGRRRIMPKSTVGKLVLGMQAARSAKSIWKALSSNGAESR
jgi:hypothetical protein